MQVLSKRLHLIKAGRKFFPPKADGREGELERPEFFTCFLVGLRRKKVWISKTDNQLNGIILCVRFLLFHWTLNNKQQMRKWKFNCLTCWAERLLKIKKRKSSFLRSQNKEVWYLSVANFQNGEGQGFEICKRPDKYNTSKF